MNTKTELMNTKTELMTLPVNINAKLTADVKKNLAQMIENIYRDKQSVFHAIAQEEKRKIIEAYKKSVNFDKLKKIIDKLEVQQANLLKEKETKLQEMRNLGLQYNGEIGETSIYDEGRQMWIKVPEVAELKTKISAIEANGPSNQYKNKLLTRLYLSTTIGEANSVMREVVGNGIIPMVNVNKLTYTKE